MLCIKLESRPFDGAFVAGMGIMMRRHLDAVLKGIDFNDLHENNIFEMTRNDLAKPVGGWLDGWVADRRLGMFLKLI